MALHRRRHDHAGRRLAAVARNAVRGLIALVLLLGAPASLALAHHPAGATDPRCDEWAAGGAPAGLDLTAICIAREVVGTYTAPATEQEPLLPFVGAALVAGMGLAIVGVVALRVASKPAARRLAAEAPLAWWVCATCRSVNASGRSNCYACRAEAPAATSPDALMPTAPTPAFDQHFGRPSG